MRGILFSAMACLLLAAGCSATPTAQPPTETGTQWPPVLGEPYPDLRLMDYTGKELRLSDFKGKVIVVEPIGTTCPACNAFSGAADVGGFEGVTPQSGLPSIESLFPQYAGGIGLNDSRIEFVQILFYNRDMKAPSLEETRQWAKHFGADRRANWHVLAARPEMLGPASYDMIPGFQLIDKQFILRSDSTGHSPHDDLYQTLLPMVPKLLDEMSVEEAYQAIPHRQTTFSPEQARMDEGEKQYLKECFGVVDQAVLARVGALQYFQNGGRDGLKPDDYQSRMDTLTQRLEALQPPAKLQNYHKMVLQALRDQQGYFRKIEKTMRFDSSDPLVQSSHENLSKAYTVLMVGYPMESQHNKDAFFDHLCALDFI